MNWRTLALILLVAGASLIASIGIGTPSSALGPSPSSHPIVATSTAHSPNPPSPSPRAATSQPQASVTSLLGVPGASTPTAMAYDLADGYLLLVTPEANASLAGSPTVGTWAYQHGSWAELSSRSAPSAREYASVVFDGQSGQVLLFGGYSLSGTYLSDTWGFSGGSWTNLTPDSKLVPPARADANLAYDSAKTSVVMFGGTAPPDC